MSRLKIIRVFEYAETFGGSVWTVARSRRWTFGHYHCYRVLRAIVGRRAFITMSPKANRADRHCHGYVIRNVCTGTSGNVGIRYTYTRGRARESPTDEREKQISPWRECQISEIADFRKLFVK